MGRFPIKIRSAARVGFSRNTPQMLVVRMSVSCYFLRRTTTRVPDFACVLARLSLIEPRETAVKLGHKLVKHFSAVAVGTEQLRSQSGIGKGPGVSNVFLGIGARIIDVLLEDVVQL